MSLIFKYNPDDEKSFTGLGTRIKEFKEKATGKKAIRNVAGEIIGKNNIDSFIPKLDTKEKEKEFTDFYSKILIKKEELKDNQEAWNQYFNTLDVGTQKVITNVAESGANLSEITGDDLVRANINARDAVLAHNKSLVQLAIKQKAAAIATAALNTLLNIGITMLVQVGVNAVMSYVNAQKELREESKEAASKIKETLDEYKEQAKTYDSLIEELESYNGQLSKQSAFYKNLPDDMKLYLDTIRDENELHDKTLEKLREKRDLINEDIDDEKDAYFRKQLTAFNNGSVDVNWGADVSTEYIHSDSIASYIGKLNKINYEEKEKIYELWANEMYGRDTDTLHGYFAQGNKAEYEKYFEEQLSLAKDTIYEYFDNDFGLLGSVNDGQDNPFVNEMLTRFILSGFNLGAFKTTLEEIIDNDELNKLYNEYLESLKPNSEIDTKEAKEAFEQMYNSLMFMNKANEEFGDLGERIFKFITDLDDYSGTDENGKRLPAVFASIFGRADVDDTLNSNIQKYKDKISEVQESINTLLDGQVTDEDIANIQSKYQMSYDTVDEYLSALMDIQDEYKQNINNDINDELGSLNPDIDTDAINKLKTLKTDVTELINEITTKRPEIERYKKDIEDLEQTYKDMVAGRTLNSEQVSELLQKYPDLADDVKVVGDAYKIEASALKDTINTQKTSANNSISYEINRTQAVIDSCMARIEAYQTEAEVIDNLTSLFATGVNTLTGKNKGSKTDTMLDIMTGVLGAASGLSSTDLKSIEDYLAISSRLEKAKDSLYELQQTQKKYTSDSNEYSLGTDGNKEEKSKEYYDWVEVKLDRLSRKTQKLGKAFEKTFTIPSATKNLKTYLSQIDKEIEGNRKGISVYRKELSKIGLDEATASKIRNGQYVINPEDSQDTKDKISRYKEYWDKILTAEEREKTLLEEKDSARASYAQKIVDIYNKQIEKIKTLVTHREKLVSIKETMGLNASKADYDYEFKQTDKQIDTLRKQNKELIKQRSHVKQGTDAWNTYNEQIETNTANIDDLCESLAKTAENLAKININLADIKVQKNEDKSQLFSLKMDNVDSYSKKNNYLDNQTRLSQSNASIWKSAYTNTDKYAKSIYNSKAFKSALKTTGNTGLKYGQLLSSSFLSKLTPGSDAYEAALRYNAAINARADADLKSKTASEESTKAIRENTKAKLDNISSYYNSYGSLLSARTSRSKTILDTRSQLGYSAISDYHLADMKTVSKDIKNELKNKKNERSKYNLKQIEKDYRNGKLSKADYEAQMAYITGLDAEIRTLTADSAEADRNIKEFNLNKLIFNLDRLKTKNDKLANDLALKQKKGAKIVAKDYKDQIKNNNTQIENYQKQNKELEKLQKNVSYGSDKWKEYQEQIDSNNASMNSLLQSNEDFKDSIRTEIIIKSFDKIKDKINQVKNALSSLIGLIDDDTLFDKKGNLTNMGIAKFSTLSQELNNVKSNIKTTQDEMLRLIKERNDFLSGIDNGYSEEEFEEDMEQLNQELMSELSESKSIVDSMVNLYLSQQQKVIDALKEEIEERSNALKKKKEYYDYDKTIRTKTKDIQALEAQKAALNATEDSLEKRKKLIELEEQLQSAQDDLESTQLEHSITLITDGLNEFTTNVQEEFDDYSDRLKSSFDEQIKIITASNEMYANGFTTIASTFNSILRYYGVDTTLKDNKGNKVFDFKAITKGYSTGGTVGGNSFTGDKVLIRVNSGESILTQEFTKMLPEALNVMDNFIKKPDFNNIPIKQVQDVKIKPEVNITIEGNADQNTITDLKKIMPTITKEVTKEIVRDLRKSGY